MDDRKFLETVRRVVRTEAAALGTLANTMDQSIVDAVNLILSIQGCVIVSGMGKSGNIARKIAATLASTGNTSVFVSTPKREPLGLLHIHNCLRAGLG